MHTKGQWKADIRSGCVAVYPAVQEYKCLSGFDDEFIHFKMGKKTGLSWEMDETDIDNARLIAAAPDYHKLAQFIAADIRGGRGSRPDWLVMLDEAIAKAEGR